MNQAFFEILSQYGIYAVLALCAVEGEITLLASGALAENGFFGTFSFAKVVAFGAFGAMIGDFGAYLVGRGCHGKLCDYRYYTLLQPRIESLINKFGVTTLVTSKFVYGLRFATCISHGMSKMPVARFVIFDGIGCLLWATILTSVGYSFSGIITTIIGDFQQVGVALLFILIGGIALFYVIDQVWISHKVEDADPAAILKLERKIQSIEDAAQHKISEIGEKLSSREHQETVEKPIETVKARAAGR